MDDKELYERGLKLRVEMFGREAVDKRMNAFGEFGKPLQHIINAYAYGDVWQRSALPPAVKSLVMVAMMAAAGHQNELRVHLLRNFTDVRNLTQLVDLFGHGGRASYTELPAGGKVAPPRAVDSELTRGRPAPICGPAQELRPRSSDRPRRAGAAE